MSTPMNDSESQTDPELGALVREYKNSAQLYINGTAACLWIVGSIAGIIALFLYGHQAKYPNIVIPGGVALLGVALIWASVIVFNERHCIGQRLFQHTKGFRLKQWGREFTCLW